MFQRIRYPDVAGELAALAKRQNPDHGDAATTPEMYADRDAAAVSPSDYGDTVERERERFSVRDSARIIGAVAGAQPVHRPIVQRAVA